jgi:hypothetical protein
MNKDLQPSWIESLSLVMEKDPFKIGKVRIGYLAIQLVSLIYRGLKYLKNLSISRRPPFSAQG